MLGLNKVFVMGNLTRDPELKYTPNGQAVASFGVATNRRWTTPEGEKRDEVEFHNIVAWGRTGETINQYLKKGNPIFVEGRLKTQNWEGPDGVRRNRTEVIVDSFQFIGSASDRTQGQAAGGDNAPARDFSQPSAPVDSGAPTPPPVQNSQPATKDNSTPDSNANTEDPFAPPPGPGTNDGGDNPDEIKIEDIPF